MRTIVLVLCAAATSAMGQTAAAVYLGGGSSGNWSGATGWSFVPASTITVTSLGVFDMGGDGLASSHDVGIFRRSDLVQIVVGEVPPGMSAPLVNGMRFVPITPVMLAGGTEYYIVANNYSVDKFVYGGTAVQFNSAISWTGFVDISVNSVGGTPVFYPPGQPGNLGPNFLFVPAPGCVAVLAAAGVMGVRRRRSSAWRGERHDRVQPVV